MSGPGFETLAIHAGQEPDPRTGAVVPPIYQVSTYAQDGVGGLRGGGQVDVVHPDPVPRHDLAGRQLAEQVVGDGQIGVEQCVSIAADPGDPLRCAVGDLDPGADGGQQLRLGLDAGEHLVGHDHCEVLVHVAPLHCAGGPGGVSRPG